MRSTLLFSALQSREQGKVAPADNKLQQEPLEMSFILFTDAYVVIPRSATLRLTMPMPLFAEFAAAVFLLYSAKMYI